VIKNVHIIELVHKISASSIQNILADEDAGPKVLDGTYSPPTREEENHAKNTDRCFEIPHLFWIFSWKPSRGQKKSPRTAPEYHAVAVRSLVVDSIFTIVLCVDG